ncbi:ankyrin repeat domain-containing protein [uncultured Jatrophihabitans sp.]|uniref:ankyrin repeat domain-containing protein n=1 Tax=uncultured Jatrophihabitans sp. TaxID=1610747 RepID=UPI0035CB000A
MSALPDHPDLAQLRRRAKDLVRSARDGDPAAVNRLAAVSAPTTLTGAQLALAREHGFAGWPRLVSEVTRRAALDARDVEALRRLLADHPGLATEELMDLPHRHGGLTPLSYLAEAPLDLAGGGWRELPRGEQAARLLLAAGAPVEGRPGDRETPLMTAASYGEVGLARALIDAGADLEARSAPDAGGVPNATALVHAAVFGMTAVVDLLVAAGAVVAGLPIAAAAGGLGDLLEGSPSDDRLLAVIMAAHHERLDVIDELLAAGVPVDREDEVYGRQALRLAASSGRARSVVHLLARGADPHHRDPARNRTALYWARRANPRHPDVETLLLEALGRRTP